MSEENCTNEYPSFKDYELEDEFKKKNYRWAIWVYENNLLSLSENRILVKKTDIVISTVTYSFYEKSEIPRYITEDHEKEGHTIYEEKVIRGKGYHKSWEEGLETIEKEKLRQASPFIRHEEGLNKHFVRRINEYDYKSGIRNPLGLLNYLALKDIFSKAWEEGEYEKIYREMKDE